MRTYVSTYLQFLLTAHGASKTQNLRKWSFRSAHLWHCNHRGRLNLPTWHQQGIAGRSQCVQSLQTFPNWTWDPFPKHFGFQLSLGVSVRSNGIVENTLESGDYQPEGGSKWLLNLSVMETGAAIGRDVGGSCGSIGKMVIAQAWNPRLNVSKHVHSFCDGVCFVHEMMDFVCVCGF